MAQPPGYCLRERNKPMSSSEQTSRLLIQPTTLATLGMELRSLIKRLTAMATGAALFVNNGLLYVALHTSTRRPRVSHRSTG